MNGEFEFDMQPGLKRKNCKNSAIKPLMSIITPFYNAGKYFEQTFNCVINQTFIWFEWIIVDDGSCDVESLKKLENLVTRDSRIKLYHKENGGPAAARNYALTKVETELIVTLDADDLIEPVYLEETYFALYFNPEAAWAYTDSFGFGDMNYIWKVPFDDKKLKKKNFLINTGVIRKHFLNLVGGYDAAQRYSHEDWNLWLSIMAQNGYPVHISGLLAWYRIVSDGALHQTNDHKDIKKRAYEHIRETAKKIKKEIEAIEYPRNERTVISNNIENSIWDLKISKESKEILILLPNLNSGFLQKWEREIKNAEAENRFHVGVIATDLPGNIAKTKLFELTDDIFELPTFLDINNYSAFINYYVISRQVDMVILDCSRYGKGMALWLQSKFSNLYIIDWAEEKKKENSFNLCYVLRKLDSKSNMEMPDQKKLYEYCIDKYMDEFNKAYLYERIYEDCQKLIEKNYCINRRKKINQARFLDTKCGIIVDSVGKLVRRKYDEYKKRN